MLLPPPLLPAYEVVKMYVQSRPGVCTIQHGALMGFICSYDSDLTTIEITLSTPDHKAPAQQTNEQTRQALENLPASKR